MRSKWSLGGQVLSALLIISLAATSTVFGASERKRDNAKGWVGVYIQKIDEDLKESENLPSTEGIYVVRVMKDSPAQKAGIKRGDIILKFDGQDAKSVSSLTRDIEDSKPGETKTVVIQRDGEKKTITVEIGKGSTLRQFSRGNESDLTPLPDIPDLGDITPPNPRAYSFSLGQISTSRIGVSLYDLSDQLADYFGAKDGGALINEVVKDGPAEKAGLKAGDVIVQVDHKPVESVTDVRRRIQEKHDGEVATVTVLRRGNEEKTVDVTVEESDTWSGVGDNRFFRARPYNANPLPGDQQPTMRRGQRVYQDAQQEMRKELDKLREELNALKKEIREKGN